MPHNRYFHPGPFKDTFSLTGDEHKHLFKVMRGAPGHTLELIDGHGHLASATIKSIDRKSAHLHITNTHFHPPSSPYLLCQALIKQPKLELITEKCTELGITEFHFFPSDNSIRDTLSDNHLTRLHQIIIAATKQSGRLYFPTIHLHTSIYIPENASYATLHNNPPPLQTTSAVLVGPESGWSSAEETLLASKATPASLHPNILRAETAAIAATAQMTHKKLIS